MALQWLGFVFTPTDYKAIITEKDMEMHIIDVGTLVRSIGYTLSFETQQQLTREVDIDNSGKIDIGEVGEAKVPDTDLTGVRQEPAHPRLADHGDRLDSHIIMSLTTNLTWGQSPRLLG